MRSLSTLLPSGRRIAVLDVALALWAAIWILIGLSVADNVEGLTELSGTVREVGGGVEQSGRTLRSLESLPLVGDRVEEPARRIESAGRSAVESGASSRDSIEDLSVLLGLAVAVIPSLPLLGFYVPLRVAGVRESRTLARAACQAGGDPSFEEFLATRAVQTLSYRRLRRVCDEPWRELASGRHERLAAAELKRLGVRPARTRADAEPSA